MSKKIDQEKFNTTCLNLIYVFSHAIGDIVHGLDNQKFFNQDIENGFADRMRAIKVEMETVRRMLSSLKKELEL